MHDQLGLLERQCDPAVGRQVGADRVHRGALEGISSPRRISKRQTRGTAVKELCVSI